MKKKNEKKSFAKTVKTHFCYTLFDLRHGKFRKGRIERGLKFIPVLNTFLVTFQNKMELFKPNHLCQKPSISHNLVTNKH